MLLGWDQDPFGAIAADVADLGAARRAELLEEAVHHLATAALGRPDQPARDVIDDQREVALPIAKRTVPARVNLDGSALVAANVSVAPATPSNPGRPPSTRRRRTTREQDHLERQRA
jgi:hypothetical protein